MTHTAADSQTANPNAQALDDLLHWLWSWRLQIERIGQSFKAEFSDGTNLQRRRNSSRFSFDEHILLVVGGNLVRAIQRAEVYYPEIKLRDDQSEALRLLRNLYEHWDEQRTAFKTPGAVKKRSAAEFVARFPEGKPWTMAFERDDWVLGGVLRLKGLTQDLERLEQVALRLEGALSN